MPNRLRNENAVSEAGIIWEVISPSWCPTVEQGGLSRTQENAIRRRRRGKEMDVTIMKRYMQCNPWGYE